MEKAILAHLEAHGCKDVNFDGAWVTFVSRDGKSCYASRNELFDEWKAGR